KFFPIYENFFKNFSVKADVSTRLSFDQTNIQLKIHLPILLEQQALPMDVHRQFFTKFPQ
ncbi:MAG: hypothetical protein K2P14_00925, partial [Anaeroplasmataceae bacterium]|nr:hypothetical protein [Anaeroplasmataceae bacterium]